MIIIKGISWEEGEKILLQNPKLILERERTGPEFQALRQLILLRKQNKISQEKLAERIQRRQSHIARLKSGEVVPSLVMLKRYARGLGQVLSFNIIPEKEFYEK